MSEYKSISFEVKDNVAYIGFGLKTKKSMTTLTEETMREFQAAIDNVYKGQSDKSIKGLVLFSHKDSCFIAGADIDMIGSLKTEAEASEASSTGQELFNKIEDLKIPTVACVHGVCLGGGLELAMTCKAIIVSDDPKTKLGLPEVQLGLIPGLGGTYRLPQRVSLPNSLDMVLSGRQINGKKAYQWGLANGMMPKERLLEQAPHYFGVEKKKRSFKDSLEHMAEDNFITRKIIFQKARENVLKKTKGFYNAPLKILEVMESGAGKSRASYLRSEAEAFGELCVSDQGKNLRHIFFMVDASKKYSGPKSEGQVPQVKRGAVLGAGTMGGGIAWLFANKGQAPLMKDIGTEALELGLKQAASNFQGALKRRKMSEDDYARKMNSISPVLDYRRFKKVDLVVEAIVENLDIKKKVFAELEKEVRPDTIVASNTSSLRVTDMAEAFEDPSRFAGLHFFNPVHRMPLVEIVTHDKVAPEVVESLYNWSLKVGKTPIVCKDGPGFLVNRILMPFMNESVQLLLEGVSIDDLDQAALNFGMPMGPCRLMDEVGLDVVSKVGPIFEKALGERAKAPDLGKEIVEQGFLGRKNSKGFYLYNEKGKTDGVNPGILKMLPNKSVQKDETTLQMRMFLPMINEAARVLEEKIVEKPADVDLGLIFGIGFPPFRGGLLKYADSEGLDRIFEALNKFKNEVSAVRFDPAPLLKDLVDKKKKFYDL